MKSKFIYAIALLLGLSLFSFCANAQNWQAYKGVWLKGYDNATQAPLPPTGYSALTYFADSLGTYVYDWDSLAWLRIPGSGGGAEGLTTADNGLIVDPAGNVRLGTNSTPGVLSSDVQINGAGNSISFGQPSSRLASFNVEGNAAHNILTTNGSYAVQLSTNTFGVASLFSTDFGSGDTGQATVDSDEIEISLSGGSGDTYAILESLGNGIEINAENSDVSVAYDILPNNVLLEIDEPGFGTLTQTTNSTEHITNITGGNGTTAITYTDSGLSMLRGSSDASTQELSFSNSFTRALWTDGASVSNELRLSATELLGQYINGTTSGFVRANATISTLDHTAPGGNARLNLSGSGNSATFSSGVTGSSLTANLSVVGTTIVNSNANLLVFPSAIDSDVSIQTNDGATVAQNSGNIILRTGNVTSGTGAVGDIEIRLGTQGGSGSAGNIEIDATSGELIFTITRTDCTGAPSGAIANVSGVLNICP